jgi:NAD(P) transhydrogenase
MNVAAAEGRLAESYGVLVIGSGPAGQKAAIQAAKAGRRVLVVERDVGVGGACVYSGTIPSKTLRETAVAMQVLPQRSGGQFRVDLGEDVRMAGLMSRLDEVVRMYAGAIDAQLRRNGVDVCRGRARFLAPDTVEVRGPRGENWRFFAEVIVIATGSRPRNPADVPVDHEHVLDSDSILSILYLPRSLAVLGGGVIACEYASIFACLGVAVTVIDRGSRPLSFLDEELTERFRRSFATRPGCRYVSDARIQSVTWDGASGVVTKLTGGEEVKTEKVLCALGRTANIDKLGLEAAGLAANERGLLGVDAHCRTAVPHIYAVGDVIGPPSLASAAMEQGRRAMCHALGITQAQSAETIPTGIYTVPEISSVGATEAAARERHGTVVVGRSEFSEIARGQIACSTDGFLKLVADARGERVLGVHVVGEGATELVHLGQLALAGAMSVDAFVDNIFNFPTMAEAYRVAALDVIRQRRARAQAAPAAATR